MQKVKPTVHEDGKETVTLFGTTVDVTGVDEFRLFKTDYAVIRDTDEKSAGKSKAKKSESKKTKADE